MCRVPPEPPPAPRAASAAADANAAGAVASLLCDRVVTRCAEQGPTALDAVPAGQLAELSAAASRFESALARVLHTLDPELAVPADLVAQTARSLAHREVERASRTACRARGAGRCA